MHRRFETAFENLCTFHFDIHMMKWMTPNAAAPFLLLAVVPIVSKRFKPIAHMRTWPITCGQFVIGHKKDKALTVVYTREPRVYWTVNA
jgi:hypothetical protein